MYCLCTVFRRRLSFETGHRQVVKGLVGQARDLTIVFVANHSSAVGGPGRSVVPNGLVRDERARRALAAKR